LIVGNGFTIDFAQRQGHEQAAGNYDPSRPLQFQFRFPDGLKRLLEAGVTDVLRHRIEDLRSLNPSWSDFELLSECGRDSDLTVRRQATYYLTWAFTLVNRMYTDSAFVDWRWTHWLQKHRTRMQIGVSFNYDLVLERALRAVDIPFYRIGAEPSEGLAIVKPHYSIDFDTDFGSPFASALKGRFSVVGSHMPQRALSEHELADLNFARCEFNLILPGSPSDLVRHVIAKPGYERFRELATTGNAPMRCLVIVGLSYWAVDRAEIDPLLEAMSPGSTVIIANPNPPELLVERVKTLGLECTLWMAGPEPI
jgi:hypothetical protein